VGKLENCPAEIGGNLNCSNNNLTSLEGCPEKVEGIFDCSHNKNLFTEDDKKLTMDNRKKLLNYDEVV